MADRKLRAEISMNDVLKLLPFRVVMHWPADSRQLSMAP
jgi:hypothetical protein